MFLQGPIGVFDSGVGGLTVAKEIHNLFPNEKIVYFGDSIHLPYGNKSRESVLKYSLSNAAFLMSKGVKAIVVACNTSSAIALETLRTSFNVPMIGVINPGAVAAIESSQNKKIGVIGTFRTISSKAYEIEIRNELQKQKSLDASKVNVTGIDCPLFVPMIESGYDDDGVSDGIVKSYIDRLPSDIDTLVLGCTHYPLLKSRIKKLYPRLNLVDSAEATAKQLYSLGLNLKVEGGSDLPGSVEVYTNDLNEVFKSISHSLFPGVGVTLVQE